MATRSEYLEALATGGISGKLLESYMRSWDMAFKEGARTAVLPDEPSSKQIVLMAAAILGQPEGTADTRDEAWAVAVTRAERAYRALVRISHESTDRKEN